MDASANESPFPESELSRDDRERARRTRIAVLVVLLILAVIFVPLTALASAVLGLFGFAMIRSALVHRQVGWPWGLAFGSVLLLFGFVSAASVCYRMVAQ